MRVNKKLDVLMIIPKVAYNTIDTYVNQWYALKLQYSVTNDINSKY